MGVVEKKEWVEKRKCPSCGTETDFRIMKVQRGEEVVLHLHKPHQAPLPCGLPCFESSGVPMADVINGNAHHPSRCRCLNTGRGFTT